MFASLPLIIFFASLWPRYTKHGQMLDYCWKKRQPHGIHHKLTNSTDKALSVDNALETTAISSHKRPLNSFQLEKNHGRKIDIYA